MDFPDNVNLNIHINSEQLDRIEQKVERIQRNMITQAQFDTDLASLVTAITALITAVNAKTAATTAFTAEDTSVQTAAAAVQTALAALNPPTPVPPVSPAP